MRVCDDLHDCRCHQSPAMLESYAVSKINCFSERLCFGANAAQDDTDISQEESSASYPCDEVARSTAELNTPAAVCCIPAAQRLYVQRAVRQILRV